MSLSRSFEVCFCPPFSPFGLLGLFVLGYATIAEIFSTIVSLFWV